MNIDRLIRLAGAASGGGVGYSVSVNYDANGDLGDTGMEIKVFRWDSVSKEGVSYCDREFEAMRGTEMTAMYRTLEEGVMQMRKDAHLSPRNADLNVRMREKGISSRRRIIEFVRLYTEENGRAPSREEIVRGACVAGGSSLDYLLRTMREAGLISYRTQQRRSVKINEDAVTAWLAGASASEHS